MSDGLSLAVAFGGGLASFFAPCVLPVVPGYLGFITGGAQASAGRRTAITVAFVLGFSAAFVVLGLLVGLAGSSLMFAGEQVWLNRLGGALIILFGLVLLGLIRVPFLQRDLRYHGQAPMKAGPVVGALGLGAAFGVGWSPCMGPILAGILLLAGIQGSAGASALLLGVYAAGLAVPFLLLGVFAERGAAFVKRFGKASRAIEVVGGIALLALGVAVFTGSAARLQSLVVG
jgi:cytochrome c-type biogenesis protein